MKLSLGRAILQTPGPAFAVHQLWIGFGALAERLLVEKKSAGTNIYIYPPRTFFKTPILGPILIRLAWWLLHLAYACVQHIVLPLIASLELLIRSTLYFILSGGNDTPFSNVGMTPAEELYMSENWLEKMGLPPTDGFSLFRTIAALCLSPLLIIKNVLAVLILFAKLAWELPMLLFRDPLVQVAILGSEKTGHPYSFLWQIEEGAPFENWMRIYTLEDYLRPYPAHRSANLIRRIAALRENETTLDLSRSRLAASTDLPQAFIALQKKRVNVLDLRGNYLGWKAGVTLAKIFAALQNTPVTTLCLAKNQLGTKTCEEWLTMLKALPPNIKKLDLSENGLGALSTNDLVQIFQVLPSSVKSVRLCRNNFENKSAEELIRIIKAFPPSLLHIDLRNTGLARFSNEPDFLQALRFSKKTFQLDPPLQGLVEVIPLFVSLHSRASTEHSAGGLLTEVGPARIVGGFLGLNTRNVALAMEIATAPLPASTTGAATSQLNDSSHISQTPVA